MKVAVQLVPVEVQSFISLLNKNHHGRMQYRDGLKENLRAFCVVDVKSAGDASIVGHLAGPHGNNVRFSVHYGGTGGKTIQVSLKPEGKKGYDSVRAQADVIAYLQVMIARVAAQKRMGRMSTKNWKGFYLRSTGLKSVGKTGEKNFDEAIKRGIISADFKATCLAVGFSMIKC